MIYIDFDGVIVDTWPEITNEYFKKFKSYDIEETRLRELFVEINWNEILKNSKINEKNISLLRNLDYGSIAILTKINTLKEKNAKIKFLKEKSIKCDIIFVDIDSSKSQAVVVENNILIDDELKNLNEWVEKDGIGILYSKNADHKDSNGELNTKYEEICELATYLSQCVDIS